MRTLPKLIYFCTINRNSNSRQSCHRTPGQEIHCANAMSSRVLSPYSVSSHLALLVCAICPIIGIIPKGGILGELQLWQCIVAVVAVVAVFATGRSFWGRSDIELQYYCYYYLCHSLVPFFCLKSSSFLFLFFDQKIPTKPPNISVQE